VSPLTGHRGVDNSVADVFWGEVRVLFVQVVKYFLDAYANRQQRGYTEGQLVEAARLLVRPLVEKSLEASQEVIDADIIDTFSKHIWGVANEDASIPPPPSTPHYITPSPNPFMKSQQDRLAGQKVDMPCFRRTFCFYSMSGLALINTIASTRDHFSNLQHLSGDRLRTAEAYRSDGYR
jgi:hypothetical protein